jgi:cytoskeletal protein CcmA (bactofilin family)
MSLFRKNPLSESPEDAAPREVPVPTPKAPPPADFLREGDLRTSLAADSEVTGKLSFTTPTRIDGKLKGELRCTQLLVIGREAIVEGWIKADVLRIEGSVAGEIAETRKVEIRATGRFVGQVSAQVVVIEDGGYLDGECRIGLVEETRERPRDAMRLVADGEHVAATVPA